MMLRLLGRTVVALLAVVVLVLLLLAWAIGTASGTRALWQVASAFVDGLQADAVEGRLAGPLTIRGLEYGDEYRQLTLTSLRLDWRPGRLLSGEFLLEQLHLDGVAFTQLKPGPPAEESAPTEVPASVELPLDLVLEDIAVTDLTYRSAPDAEAVIVERAALAASLRGDQLRVETLSARGPLFAVAARAQVRTRDGYPLDVSADWEVRPAELAAVTGKLSVSGDLQVLEVRQRILAPYRIEQTTRLEDLLGELRLDSAAVIDGLALREVGATLPEVTVSGELSSSGTVDDLALRSDLDIESPLTGPLALAVSARFRDQVLALEEFLLTGSEALRLQLDGSVDLSDEAPAFDVEVAWQALRWPLAEAPRIRSADGGATLRGALQDYALDLQAGLEVPGQTGGALTLAGRGDAESFDLSQLRLALLDGRLEGNARVRWAPDIQGSVVLDGEGLDPSVLLPDLPGDLQLTVRAEGGLSDGQPVAQVDRVSVSGTLLERPLNLDLKGQLDGARFDLETLALRAGASEISAQGQLTEQFDLDWRIDSPDLDELLPGAGGSLRGEGHVEGSRSLPAVRAVLQGRALRYGEFALALLDLDADVDLAAPTPSDLSLSASGGQVGTLTLTALELSGSGTRAEHALQLRADTSAGEAELGISGDLREDVWAIRVTEGRLQYADLGPWTLDRPHEGLVGLDAQRLDEGCWRSAEARLCLQGERGPERLAAAVDLQAFALDYLRPLLPEAIGLQGVVAAQATLAQRGAAEPVIDAEITAEGVELSTTGVDDEPGSVLLALAPARITLAQGEQGLRADLALPFIDDGGISGQVQVAGGAGALAQRPLGGDFRLDVNDLSVLAALSPEIERAAGSLHGQLQLAGSLAEPQPEGEIDLSDAALHLAAPGLRITDIGLRVRSEGDAGLVFDGSARSGGGTLSLDGKARLNGAGPQVDLTVEGDAFQVVDTRDARVFVSPDLTIAAADGGVEINGEVLVPRAAITPQQLPQSAVSASADQVVITGEEDSGEAPAASATRANIRVTLGDEVNVDGFGFKGRLTGSLVVKQVPGKPATGTGELKIIDGEYRAYGQGLVIERGEILFPGGPLDKPGINVRAVRRPEEGILVGVRVRGPAEQPNLEIFSEPGMSQTEQLSWLLLGRPLEGASEGEGDMLAQAAMMLGMKGGNTLAQKLGGSLGVDDIGFKSGSGEAGSNSDTSQAAFVVGKYLTPDLYVSYGIGLFESVSTVTLQYTLSENWKLSTESSTYASGGDVIYTIER